VSGETHLSLTVPTHRLALPALVLEKSEYQVEQDLIQAGRGIGMWWVEGKVPGERT
jgi:hypothetical protein